MLPSYVEFSEYGSLDVGLFDFGKLVVTGGLSGVLFTSTSSEPQPGAWPGISIGTQDLGSELTGLTIEYGGSYGACLTMESSSVMLTVLDRVTVQNCRGFAGANISAQNLILTHFTATNNEGNGLFIGGGIQDLAIENLTLTNNGIRPLILPTNVAHALDDTAVLTPNADSRVELIDGSIVGHVTWKNVGIPYVATNTISVISETPSSTSLTLEDGVELEFDNGLGLDVGIEGFGRLEAFALDTPIVFRSSDRFAAPGAWQGITLGLGDEESILYGVVVSNGGGNDRGNVTVYTTAPEIDASHISESSSYGIYRVNGVAAQIGMDMSYENNASGDVF